LYLSLVWLPSCSLEMFLSILPSFPYYISTPGLAACLQVEDVSLHSPLLSLLFTPGWLHAYRLKMFFFLSPLLPILFTPNLAACL
jgi:hypothetical protein